MQRLKPRSRLVTGGASGIGEAPFAFPSTRELRSSWRTSRTIAAGKSRRRRRFRATYVHADVSRETDVGRGRRDRSSLRPTRLPLSTTPAPEAFTGRIDETASTARRDIGVLLRRLPRNEACGARDEAARNRLDHQHGQVAGLRTGLGPHVYSPPRLPSSASPLRRDGARESGVRVNCICPAASRRRSSQRLRLSPERADATIRS